MRDTTDTRIAGAYSAAGSAWSRGPARIYDRLAEVLVQECPVDLAGASAVDIGAGTGAAGRAVRRAGAAAVVEVDVAIGMLQVDVDGRSPRAVASATDLPFRDGTFDVALAAFSFNHAADPRAAFAEAARVVRRGGAVVATAYAADDTHPVKEAVTRALLRRGWRAEAWFTDLMGERAPMLATVEAARSVARSAGLDATATNVRVLFSSITTAELIEWRLGMAHTAGFTATLPCAERDRLVREVACAVGEPPPPLLRSIITVSAIR